MCGTIWSNRLKNFDNKLRSTAKKRRSEKSLIFKRFLKCFKTKHNSVIFFLDLECFRGQIYFINFQRLTVKAYRYRLYWQLGGRGILERSKKWFWWKYYPNWSDTQIQLRSHKGSKTNVLLSHILIYLDLKFIWS